MNSVTMKSSLGTGRFSKSMYGVCSVTVPSLLKNDKISPLLFHSGTGTSTGAPLSLIKNTTNFAGLVLLAFLPTTCMSSGPS